MIGKKKMEYPYFSSKAVNGKPLFLWALEKKINEIEIPKKKIEIYKINLEKIYFVNLKKVKKNIFLKIKRLKKVEESSKKLGKDFRREEVFESWEKSLCEFSLEQNFIILRIKTKVSSGTYMRNLAQEVGEKFGTTGLAYSIKRTKFF
jgi:tRNA U55 pseudouridine synthase TruB